MRDFSKRYDKLVEDVSWVNSVGDMPLSGVEDEDKQVINYSTFKTWREGNFSEVKEGLKKVFRDKKDAVRDLRNCIEEDTEGLNILVMALDRPTGSCVVENSRGWKEVVETLAHVYAWSLFKGEDHGVLFDLVKNKIKLDYLKGKN